MLDFNDVYSRLAGRLVASSKMQRVPGLTADEVHEEMLLILWKAVRTYDPEVGTSIEQWWWSIWVNKKSDLIERAFALKRRSEVLMDDQTLLSLAPLVMPEDLIPEAPVQDSVGQKVWLLLAQGYTGTEVRQALNLSVRRFYVVLDMLRESIPAPARI